MIKKGGQFLTIVSFIHRRSTYDDQMIIIHLFHVRYFTKKAINYYDTQPIDACNLLIGLHLHANRSRLANGS
jgi:hypothetical protein